MRLTRVVFVEEQAHAVDNRSFDVTKRSLPG